MKKEKKQLSFNSIVVSIPRDETEALACLSNKELFQRFRTLKKKKALNSKLYLEFNAE